MARKRKVFLAFVVAAGIGAVAAVMSCSTVDRVIVPPPMIPGAKFVGMETCMPCHNKMVKDFKLTSHSRVTIPGEGERVEGQGCESCHGAGSVHVDKSDPEKNGGNIINPGNNPEGCFACHLDKKAEFNLPYHHPLREGRMTCLNCHDPHGENIKAPKGIRGRGPSIIRSVNDTCAQCHREQARPHVFEHEALREGCTVCHKVHGSINQKLLIERDANLCLKCHAQSAPLGAGNVRKIFIGASDHSSRLSQGPCFSAGCHTGIHGSNINAHLRY